MDQYSGKIDDEHVDDLDLFLAFERLFEVVNNRFQDTPSSRGVAILTSIEHLAERVLSDRDYWLFTQG